MSGIKEEPLQQILSRYGISTLSIRNESYKEKKGVWWIKTPEGNKILKKISNSEDTLKFIHAAVKYLSSNGVKIPAIINTSDKRSYACFEGTCYVLSEAVEGRNPSYSSPGELSLVVRGLAAFHAAAAGFKPSQDSKPKNHLGTWIEEYQRELDDMSTFYQKELSLDKRSGFGEFVIKAFPYFRQRAEQAIDGLKSGDYQEWVKKITVKGCLCHQDFAAGNLITSSNGALYVLDTDSITIDIPARDIRKLLNKVMKKNGTWDRELASRIFSHYQAVNPLSLSEWNVVKLDLMYPHLFLGAMNKYYYQRDSEWSAEKYLQRLKEMSTLEKSITPVLENFSALLPLKNS